MGGRGARLVQKREIKNKKCLVGEAGVCEALKYVSVHPGSLQTGCSSGTGSNTSKNR